MYLALLQPSVKFTKRMEGNADSERLEESHGATWKVFVSMQIRGEGIDATLAKVRRRGTDVSQTTSKVRQVWARKALQTQKVAAKKQ